MAYRESAAVKSMCLHVLAQSEAYLGLNRILIVSPKLRQSGPIRAPIWPGRSSHLLRQSKQIRGPIWEGLIVPRFENA